MLLLRFLQIRQVALEIGKIAHLNLFELNVGENHEQGREAEIWLMTTGITFVIIYKI